MSKNEIIIKGDYAEILIPDKKYGIVKSLIDIEDINNICGIRWRVCQAAEASKKMLYVVSSKSSRLHRLIMDCPKDLCIDHINRNTLDNRKNNLRICTHFENMQNRADNSEHIGVLKRHRRWIAYIGVNYKRIYLGSYNNFDDAVQARKSAELLYYGHHRVA